MRICLLWSSDKCSFRVKVFRVSKKVLFGMDSFQEVRKTTLNILLAEDDRNLGIVMKSELEEEKYIVDLVNDGVEAVLSFIDKSHNFVFLDIKMPKLDGINALRIIKKINPNVPVITFSGNAGSSEMAESVKAGALKCFTKPFEIAELRDCIKSHFGDLRT